MPFAISPVQKDGFRLTFPASRFPGSQHELTWLREEDGGNCYRLDDPVMEGWLCPALFRYFDTAPEHTYVMAEAKAGV